MMRFPPFFQTHAAATGRDAPGGTQYSRSTSLYNLRLGARYGVSSNVHRRVRLGGAIVLSHWRV